MVTASHTITLSSDGKLHSFGHNHKGQLGLGHYNDVNLKQIYKKNKNR